MANRVTSEDILRMNEIYYKTHVFAEVARQTGFSASTVRKYVDVNWKPVVSENIIKFEMDDLPEFDTTCFKGVDNYGELCVLTEREQEEMKELWGELSI
jgi:hypothetical protein